MLFLSIYSFPNKSPEKYQFPPPPGLARRLLIERHNEKKGVIGSMPLRDIRILDLTRGLSGSLATKYLTNYGAEVIKIEPPEGDPTRLLPDGPGPVRGHGYDRHARRLPRPVRPQHPGALRRRVPGHRHDAGPHRPGEAGRRPAGGHLPAGRHVLLHRGRPGGLQHHRRGPVPQGQR